MTPPVVTAFAAATLVLLTSLSPAAGSECDSCDPDPWCLPQQTLFTVPPFYSPQLVVAETCPRVCSGTDCQPIRGEQKVVLRPYPVQGEGTLAPVILWVSVCRYCRVGSQLVPNSRASQFAKS